MNKYLTTTALTLLCTVTTLLADTATDPGNVAYLKPTRSNLSKTLAQNVTDGNPATTWSGAFFPAYVDVDLMERHDIEKIVLHFPEGKNSYYTIYGSNDGKNYDRIYRTREAKRPTAEGEEIVFDTPESYRIVRVQVEYTSGDNKAYLSEIKVSGKKTGADTATLRQGLLENILGVEHFDRTQYNHPITDAETIGNIYGIIDRTVGAEYRSWFTFELADTQAVNDYFELSDTANKVHIKGNNGLSLATGLNHYFKNYVNVHISEQTKQVNMPGHLVPIGGIVRKETPYKVRYAFNYCTLNYTFSFFGEEEWQRENDWLALNGVNVVLDLAGQEATWIKFLMNFGYTFDDAKDWLTGPAYYAWQFMDNMESFGGPVPDGYVKDRLELARKTQRWKRSLGMQTVLQGYAGMVPTNFTEFQPDAKVIKQGNWNGFARPWMIATDSPEYDDYARKFYDAQEFVYGKTSDYYAVDPFHEGGIRPEGLTDNIISREVLESLLEYNKDAVWIVQGWQSNPTNSLLHGMGEHRNKHVLIVDLIKYPLKSWTKYNKLKYDNTTLDSIEFNGTDWAWCLLSNFGGNPSMHGQMDVMVEDILAAQKTSKHMQGIGIISEAAYDNPILYDLIFDLMWAGDDFDLGRWIDKYIERRYGAVTENARKAWQIMRETNYNHGVRYTNELFGMKSKAPQDYQMQDIPYGARNLEKAFRLLAADFELFRDNECYRYDMTEIMRQVVSNYAVLTYNEVLKVRRTNSLSGFTAAKEKFLRSFDVLNEVQATQREQLGGEWIGKAADRAASYDDFTRDAFEMNAKTLITTWGSRGGSSLKDYGWRNYEGMFVDIYKRIWSEFLDKVEKKLRDGTSVETIPASGYFEFYWNWIMNGQEYARIPKDSPEDIRRVVDLVIENCSLGDDTDPNAGNIALNRSAWTEEEGRRKIWPSITDGREDVEFVISIHTDLGPSHLLNRKKSTPQYPKIEIVVDLIGEFQISKVNLVLGRIGNECEFFVGSDGKTWEKIGETGKVAIGDNVINIDNKAGRFIKVVAIPPGYSMGLYLTELRVYGERILPTLEQLGRFVGAAKALDLRANPESQIVRAQELLKTAESAFANAAPPDEVNTAYWNLYDQLVSMDLSGRVNVAKGKPVTAHNDPAGNSDRINDGDATTFWDSGRLSVTGKPYEDKIVPGWIIVDLEEVYEITEIKLTFPKENLWHKYEIYVSRDNKKWTLAGKKTTAISPNVKARYVKISTTDIQSDRSGKRYSYIISELEVYGKLLPN